MLNKVILIGRLTRDPELRYTPNGKPVANFALAVDRNRTNPQSGEKETDFIDIVVWEKQAEICAQYLNKGRLVAVEGRLQVRSYEAQDGTRRRVAEVVAQSVRFLEGRRTAEGGNPGGNQGGNPGGNPGDGGFGSEVNMDDDDVPF